MKELRILYLSTFPPRECGIATFTKDLIDAVSKINPYIEQGVIAIQEKDAPKRNYSNIVKYEIDQEEPSSYDRAAEYINRSGANVLCIQHEYGIFGGFDGIFILEFLKKIKIPVVSFFHSIPTTKEAKRRNYRLGILKEIGKKSKYINTFITGGKRVLYKELEIPQEKINSFYHPGPYIPLPTERAKNIIKKKYNLLGKFLISTQGLITRNKGIDYGIEAIKKLSKKYPELVYLIIGKAHPACVNMTSPEEKNYYSNLRKQAQKAKISKNVKFINRFVTSKEMLDLAKITDIYLIPYIRKEQISSGVVSYALATGNCIVSTPFSYTEDVLRGNRGRFIKFRDSKSIEKVISELMENPEETQKIRERAYEFGKKISWPEMAKKYIRIFKKSIQK